MQQQKQSLFKELLQRRVFQIVGIYLGAILALMEFTGMVVERYGITDRMVDMVLAGMTSFIPAIIILAWRHGAPGKDEWGRAEKIGVPINALVTLSVVLLVNASKPTQQTHSTMPPETPTVSQQVSVSETQPIPHLGIWFFEPINQKEEKNWLAYGLPYLIKSQLSQEKAIMVKSLHDSNAFWPIKRAGFTDGLNVPLPLANSIAADSDLDYFVRGEFTGHPPTLTLNLKVYQTGNSQPLKTLSLTAENYFDLAIEASQQLKQMDFIVPSTRSDVINEIPLRDFITANRQAFKAFILGINEILFRNDYDAAIAKTQRAVELDPSFAQAYIQLGNYYSEKGNLEPATRNIKKALSLDYKLTARQRFSLRAMIYAMEQKTDEQIGVYESWIELYPKDYEPVNRLANILIYKSNDRERSIELFKKSLSLNPSQTWIYQRLAILYQSISDYPQAMHYYKKYAKEKPQAFTPLIGQAQVAMRMGDLALAEKQTQKATLLRVDKVTPIITLVELAIRQGQFEQVEDRFREAEMIAQSPRQLGLVHQKRVIYHQLLGQNQRAFDELQSLQAIINEYEEPLDAWFVSFISKIHLYAFMGREAEAFEKLVTFKNELDPALLDVVEFGYLFLNIELGELDKAEQALKKVTRVIEQFEMKNLSYLVEYAAGRISEQRKDFTSAVKHYQQSRALYAIKIQDEFDPSMEFYIVERLINALREVKDYEQAIEVANQYLPQWPMHPFMNFQISRVFQETQQLELANQHLEKALKIWQQSDMNCYDCQQAEQMKESIKAR